MLVAPILIFLHLGLVVNAVLLPQGENGTVTVQIEDGVLRGQIATSTWNRTYYSFQGIPFAQPPVGELRFKSPKPVKPWTGVRDAIAPASYCSQEVSSLVPNADVISEDCLYLNVYVPQEAVSNLTSKGLTVMVWIHGGGFSMGSGVTDRPGNLMNYSIILVTTNYRLGPFGFLSLEHPDVTSNAALKDQVAALRWVKKNIAQFGGNPDDVTIFGESAGGESVDFLQLSPMTKGLFHRAISQSGSVEAVDFNPNYNRNLEAFRLGWAIGFNGTTVIDLVKFLKAATPEDILKGRDNVRTEEGIGPHDLTNFPVIDARIQDGSEVFLTDTPENLLRAGKAHPNPYIIGFNRVEGLLFTNDLSQETLDSYNANPEQFVPQKLHLLNGSAESTELGAKIKHFYFGNKNISFDTLQQLTDLISDTFMTYNVYRSAMFHLNYGSTPVYMYEFTYQGTFENHSGNTSIKGPAHGEDVNYLFSNVVPYKPDKDDYTLIKHFCNMWVDYAQTGNPSLHESVKWIPMTKTNHTYLQIDVELSLHQDALKERMAFWDEVYDTYRK